LLAAPSIVLGQSLKEQFVGAWEYVSIYNEVEGVKQHFYGEKPVGLTVFDRSGYVISFLSKPELPKFAAKNRLKGTDAEYRGVMQGMISGYGTYAVEGDTVTIKLTIRNSGREEVRLTGSSSCPPFGFGIRGADHQPVHFPDLPRICTADLRVWTVAAGGSIQHTFRWSGEVLAA
jgi:hypothetical protein